MFKIIHHIFLNVEELSNFNEARKAINLNVLGEQLLNTNARIFQRADAFNSLNVVTTAQLNFSLQSGRLLTQQQALLLYS